MLVCPKLVKIKLISYVLPNLTSIKDSYHSDWVQGKALVTLLPPESISKLKIAEGNLDSLVLRTNQRYKQ